VDTVSILVVVFLNNWVCECIQCDFWIGVEVVDTVPSVISEYLDQQGIQMSKEHI
jgi:hypothetical protein